MLEWIKVGHFGEWEGYEDGTLIYRVQRYDDQPDWEWIYCPGDEYSDDLYLTTEEAKAAAEAHHKKNSFEIDWSDFEPLSLEEIDEILGDRLYDERKEEGLF